MPDENKKPFDGIIEEGTLPNTSNGLGRDVGKRPFTPPPRRPDEDDSATLLEDVGYDIHVSPFAGALP